MAYKYAYEPNHLRSSQSNLTIKRLNLFLEQHHRRLAADALPDVVDPPIVIKRRWWSALRWRSRQQNHATEARTRLSRHNVPTLDHGLTSGRKSLYDAVHIRPGGARISVLKVAKSDGVLNATATSRTSRLASAAIFAAGATAVAAAGQILSMPQVHAWKAELVAVFMRELSRW